MSLIQLRRGDTVTLQFTALATSAGVTLPTFATGDVVAFTLRQTYDDPSPLVSKVSSDVGSITVNIGFATGSVNIASTDWQDSELGHELLDCVWDLQLTRANGSVLTIAEGLMTVLPDVTHA